MDLLIWWIAVVFLAVIVYKIVDNWDVFSTNPFTFRPAEAADDVKDWENNWASNAIAWFSQVFLRSWCDNEDHWSAKFADYFFAECPCCLLWRGFGLGFLTASLLATVIAGLAWF